MGLTMAPAETRQDQPPFLLSVDDTMYSVRLGSVPSVRPVARWRCTTPDDFSAMAVCGSSILGLLKDSRTVVVHDAVTLAAAAPGPELRSVQRMPVMLAVGDDMVVVMDRVLRRRRDDGGSSPCCFEALRRLPGGGGGWRADPLPDAPVPDLDADEEELELEDEVGEDDYYNEDMEDEVLDDVETYFLMGTRLWISGHLLLGLGRVEGGWELPVLSHRAIFVEELGCAVGLVPSYDDPSHCHQVCAIDVVEAQQEHRAPVLRHVWEFPTEHANGVPPGEMINFTHLGNGTFCMLRCVIVDRYMRRGTSFTLLDLDFTSLPGAEEGPRLVKRGETHVHGWQGGSWGVALLFK
ncbi:hypothetical protein BDA96_04G169100 [Sorghum bicolor]|uniref:Uncharacterized protein n=1 Tax=Sorghum bicolor TaxID=4558 RepID=A0A921R5Z1_SORBI|nr:hypothetical protein BDA96_04G169100 [Sorghum bicolor]